MKSFNLTILALVALSLTASASFTVEGRFSSVPTIWNHISDFDHNPNQAVTDFGSVNVGSHKDRRYRITNISGSIRFWNGASSDSSQFEILTSSGQPQGYPIVFAPGVVREFIIRYTPSTTARTAIISLPNTAPGLTNPYTFAVKGVGLVPDARISGRPSTSSNYDNILDGETTIRQTEGTDFGMIPVGSPVVRYFKLTNDGNKALDLNSTAFTGAFASNFKVDGLSLSNLGPGNSREFTITFTPTSAGTRSTTFQLVSDDHDENPYEFNLQGLAVAFPDIRVRGLQGVVATTIEDKDLSASKEVTQFGNVNVGTTKSRTYRIINDGNASLTVSSIKSNDSAFTIPGPPTVVPVDEHRDFVINFTPTERITTFATITVESNDPDDEDSYTFAVKGTGQGPEIVVRAQNKDGLFESIADGTTSTSTFNGTDFGDVRVTNGESVSTFAVTNAGDKSLRIRSRKFTDSGADHFSVSGLLAGNPFADLGPTESRTFTITFDPSSAGSKVATFSIENTDADEDPFTFRVRGSGRVEPNIRVRGLTKLGIASTIADGDENPDQEVTHYGNVNPGTVSTRVFRIVNDGDATLTISSITSSSTAYTIPGPPTSIAPGDSTDFVIDFRPASVGTDQTLITINSNDPDSENPYTFALTGVGDGPEIKVETLGLFGADPPIEITDGQTATAPGNHMGSYNLNASPMRTISYRVTNLGTKSLRLSGRSFSGSGSKSFQVDGLLAGNPFANLSPGNTRDFTITFTPTSTGSKLATFSIDNNDGDEDPFTFRVQGIAVQEPIISVEGRSGGSLTNWNILHGVIIFRS